MNPYSALEDSNEPLDPTNVEFFKFKGLVPDAKVSLQEESFDNTKYPATVSLIAVSNKHGYVAAATTSGFILDSTKLLRKTFYSAKKSATVALEEGKISVPLKSAVHQIRFSAEETQLLVATEGGKLLVYNVDDINNNKENVSPIQSFDLGHDIIDLRPNPEAVPNLAAVLFNNNQCKIIDITNGNTVSHLPADNVSAICWSPKGKQIVCGKRDGGLQHFDTNGAVKAELSIPKLMSVEGGQETQNRYVHDVLWIENHIFLVLYSRKRETEHDEFIHDGYIINRKPANGTNVPEYIRLAEITPIFSDEGRGNHFYMETIRNLGKEVKHAVIIANAATSELSVVGQDENGEWATWALPEDGVLNLPLSDETSMDTFPLGIAIDFTVDERLPSLDASEGDIGLSPMPVFYILNDEGHIGAYHCYNIEIARRNEPYSITASFTGAATTSTSTTTTSVAKGPEVTTPEKPSGFAAFGSASSSNTGSFGDLLSGKSESPTVGFGGFGGSIPSFSNLGSAQKIPATPSTGFGAVKATSSAAVPSFGSTTNIGFSSTKPVTTTVDKPLSSFGITTNKAEAAPTFGSTSTFGSASKQPTTSAFGSTSTTSAFGSTSTQPTTTSFGSTSTQPAASGFGSTSTMGGFGSLALNKVSGATNPTTTPSFGSTSAVGGFGSLALNKVPGATNPTTTPSFGSTSAVGGFGSLALNKVPGATNPTTTPATGFGSSTGSFGSSSTTQQPTTASTGFGSTMTQQPTGFEATKFATSSAMTAVPIPSVKTSTTSDSGSLAKNTTAAPAFGSTNTLGGGGFGSLAKNTVPGAIAPSSKPLFGTPSSLEPKPTKEKLTVTAKSGMAREYEAIYIKVTEGIEELSVLDEKISKAIASNSSSTPKTKDSLKDKNSTWNLNDVAEYGALTQSIIESITKDQSDTITESLQNLSINCKKSMDKKEDIKYLLQKEVNSDVVDMIDNRELDPEAKQVLNTVENKSEAYESVLSNLEFKIQEYKKRIKIKRDHNAGKLTLYSLHRAVRDIQKDIVGKKNTLTELEEKLANVKLNDSRRKAQQSTAGFSCQDVSDSEDDDEEEEVSTKVIEHTAKYFRRFNFLGDLCDKTSARTPLQCPVE
ncbi:hypothetical protein INT48_005902 [Thamnidium elegans]|uniref:Nucleoporin Nup159/Nup146 N-terminal domain-containing protein n=1 Tax=Thamnidium elegans TaxID=101142 RepID=A0A8H7VXC9_9FUNG|nr:hypothetical protein INT48_005902 [Thamnidium elegans]